MSFQGVFGGASGSGGGGSSIQYTGGDVSNTKADDAVLTLGANKVTTAKILDANVTLAKIVSIPTDTLIGRDTAATGVPESIGVGGSIEFSGAKALQLSQFTGGDVTTSKAGSLALTIPNNTVTYAKMQDVSATSRLLGRGTAGAGDVEELSIGGGLEFSSGAPRVANTIPARDTENVRADLVPTVTNQGAVTNGGTLTASFTTTAGKRYMISADVWLENSDETLRYCKAMVIRCYRKSSGNAIIVGTAVIDDPTSTESATFVASVSTNDIVVTFTNNTGATRDANILLGVTECDTP